MVLLNKTDLDVINAAFHKAEYADSLNSVNDNLIWLLSLKSEKLEAILADQKIIISNNDIQISNIKTQKEEVISDLEKQLKRANTHKTIWECISGVSMIAVVLLAIF